MAMNSLQNLEQVLIQGSNEIHVDAGTRRRAVIPIERMLEFARTHGISGKFQGNA
jgi:quinolinate synthase